ncbi:tubulin-specific chaperone E [Plutella xylostella]|uniref:tubulin-specific chaperone E n=1 Tax=Plutella xylostella TaxID=51655 RepID=UPI002032C98A|nr:tubulin-specific chaperone E [Plutella xylostella]
MVGAMPVNLIPKFCNGAMDSQNNRQDGELLVDIGSRIKCSEHFATVKYIGEVQGYKGTWYGVEWDDPARGKHDGSVDGIQYFKTSGPKSGSFIRPNKIEPLVTCAEAIKKCYGDKEDEMIAAHRKNVINEWKREMGAPFIEMVGFEKIHQKQKLDRLVEVCVHNQNVCSAGDVSALCPGVQVLDLSKNLFCNWREVITLGGQLPGLCDLDVSNNRMPVDIPQEALAQLSRKFPNLRKINLSHCDYEWSDIVALSQLWPQLTEMVAAFNQIHRIFPPTDVLSNLSALWLDGNPIKSWGEVLGLGQLKSLKMLSLNDCAIEEIRFNDVPKEKVDAFENLELLFLNRTKIGDWRSISELNKLKNLKKLYFLKNPIQAGGDYETTAQLIVAKIGSLQELNGSHLTPEFRRGAEYDYMKQHGAEWKKAQANEAMKMAFDVEHHRFDELITKYGIPDDSLLEKQVKNNSLVSSLLQITLQDENGTKYVKKFPATMSVSKLVTLAQRLFAKHGHTGTPNLYCYNEQRKDAEIHLDNIMRDLSYFSVRNGDTILVR